MKKQPVGQTLGRIASSTRIVTETDVYDPVTNPDGMLVTDATLATKQDKLVAGENITIVGNTISATGGGADITADATLSASSTNPIQNQWLGKRMGATENNSVQIGYDAKAGECSNTPVSDGDNGLQVAVGRGADGSDGGTAVGYNANGSNRGIAVGYCTIGTFYSVAVGYGAASSGGGVAVGHCAAGSGTAVGTNAQSYNGGAAVGTSASGNNGGAAVGHGADGQSYGAAVGCGADGHDSGVAVGYNTYGYGSGTAVGRGAHGYSCGAAVGSFANGYSYGAAVGHYADGRDSGAAVGYFATGPNYGTAVGPGTQGCTYGTAVGYLATGSNYGIAIGYNSTTRAVSYTATVGVESYNSVQYSLQISAYNNAQQTFFAQRLIAGETLDDSYIDFYHKDRVSGEIKGRRISATNFFALLDANGATDDVPSGGGDYSGDVSA